MPVQTLTQETQTTIRFSTRQFGVEERKLYGLSWMRAQTLTQEGPMESP